MFLQFSEKFLGMWAGLWAGSGYDVFLNFIPILTVHDESIEKFDMLLISPLTFIETSYSCSILILEVTIIRALELGIKVFLHVIMHNVTIFSHRRVSRRL